MFCLKRHQSNVQTLHKKVLELMQLMVQSAINIKFVQGCIFNAYFPCVISQFQTSGLLLHNWNRYLFQFVVILGISGNNLNTSNQCMNVKLLVSWVFDAV